MKRIAILMTLTIMGLGAAFLFWQKPTSFVLSESAPKNNPPETSIPSATPEQGRENDAIQAPTSIESLPDQKFTTLLESAERGNGESAYLAALEFRTCNVYANEIVRWEIIPVGERPSVDRATLEKIKKCEDVWAYPKNLEYDLIAQAAAKGVVKAQVDYYLRGSPGIADPLVFLKDPSAAAKYKEESVRYLQAAVTSGSSDAMLLLATIHNDGVLVERNRVAALAYAEAGIRINPSRNAIRLRDRFASQLSADELGRGQAQAQQIIESCCGG